MGAGKIWKGLAAADFFCRQQDEITAIWKWRILDRARKMCELPEFSGEQSARQTSRELEGGNPCRRESTARGNQPNSAYAEFGCSRKIVPTAPATARPAPRSPRSSDAPASRFANGASRRSATPESVPGPEQRRQGRDQGAGAREQGVAHRQRDPEEGVGLFCPGGARPLVPQMISFVEEHREACGVEPTCRVLPTAPST